MSGISKPKAVVVVLSILLVICVVLLILIQPNSIIIDISTDNNTVFSKYSLPPALQDKVIDEFSPVISVDYRKKIDDELLSEVGNKILSLHLVQDGSIAHVSVLARYYQYDGRLYLVPTGRLGTNLTFAVQLHRWLGKKTTVLFRTPAFLPTDKPLAELITWYPSGDTVPANTLVFYAVLSQPVLMHTSNVLSFNILNDEGIELLDDTNKALSLTSQALPRNLGEYRKVIPFMIHPGRIKRGVKLRELHGLVMKPYHSYALTIDHSIYKDEYLRSIIPITPKTYYVVAEDRELPKFYRTQSQIPQQGTRDPIRLTFSEDMDFDSIRKGVYIYKGIHKDSVDDRTGDSGKEQVEIIHVENYGNDHVWSMYPRQVWESGTYTVELTTLVKDLAHNTLHIPFETSTLEERDKRYSEFWVFEIR